MGNLHVDPLKFFRVLEVRHLFNLRHKKGVGGTDIIHWVEVAHTGTCRPGAAIMSHVPPDVYMMLFKENRSGRRRELFEKYHRESQYAWMSTTFIFINVNNKQVVTDFKSMILFCSSELWKVCFILGI